MEQGSKIISVCHQPNLSSWPTSCVCWATTYIYILPTYIFEENIATYKLLPHVFLISFLLFSGYGSPSILLRDVIIVVG